MIVLPPSANVVYPFTDIHLREEYNNALVGLDDALLRFSGMRAFGQTMLSQIQQKMNDIEFDLDRFDDLLKQLKVNVAPEWRYNGQIEKSWARYYQHKALHLLADAYYTALDCRSKMETLKGFLGVQEYWSFPLDQLLEGFFKAKKITTKGYKLIGGYPYYEPNHPVSYNRIHIYQKENWTESRWFRVIPRQRNLEALTDLYNVLMPAAAQTDFYVSVEPYLVEELLETYDKKLPVHWFKVGNEVFIAQDRIISRVQNYAETSAPVIKADEDKEVSGYLFELTTPLLDGLRTAVSLAKEHKSPKHDLRYAFQIMDGQLFLLSADGLMMVKSPVQNGYPPNQRNLFYLEQSVIDGILSKTMKPKKDKSKKTFYGTITIGQMDVLLIEPSGSRQIIENDTENDMSVKLANFARDFESLSYEGALVVEIGEDEDAKRKEIHFTQGDYDLILYITSDIFTHGKATKLLEKYPIAMTLEGKYFMLEFTAVKDGQQSNVWMRIEWQSSNSNVKEVMPQ